MLGDAQRMEDAVGSGENIHEKEEKSKSGGGQRRIKKKEDRRQKKEEEELRRRRRRSNKTNTHTRTHNVSTLGCCDCSLLDFCGLCCHVAPSSWVGRWGMDKVRQEEGVEGEDERRGSRTKAKKKWYVKTHLVHHHT